MIKNDRQHAITKRQAKLLEDGLAEFIAEHGPQPADPLKRAQRDALESQLAELREELHEYEALVAAGPSSGRRRPLAELPDALIEARIASRLTQKQLAERLEMKEQQIQRYEANDYVSASFGRILDVVDALDDFDFTFQLERTNESASNVPTQGSSGVVGPQQSLSPFGPWVEPPMAALTTEPWRSAATYSAATQLEPVPQFAGTAYPSQWDQMAATRMMSVRPAAIGLGPQEQGVVYIGGHSGSRWRTHLIGMHFDPLAQQTPGIVILSNWAEPPVPFGAEPIMLGGSLIRHTAVGHLSGLDLATVGGSGQTAA